jgi:predicted peptidase
MYIEKVKTGFWVILVWLLFLSGCVGVDGDDMSGQQQAMSFTGDFKRQISLRYLLYLPEDCNSEKEYPLILFLHGMGERGDNLEDVKRHGLPKLVSQGKDFTFIIVSPQCPAEQMWKNIELMGLLDHIEAEYSVDESRIYLTGLSMGGFGSWKLATEYPERFAAIAPVCGGGEPRLGSKMLKDTPVWVFHGEDDEVVPLESSERMVEALTKEGGDVKFTVYPDTSHNSWDEAYATDELYEWFLQHKKGH